MVAVVVSQVSEVIMSRHFQDNLVLVYLEDGDELGGEVSVQLGPDGLTYHGSRIDMIRKDELL